MKQIAMVIRATDGTIVASAAFGADIELFAEEVVELSKAEGALVFFEFNGVRVEINERSAPQEIAQFYWDEFARRSAKYRGAAAR
jgi:hypothetical protein